MKRSIIILVLLCLGCTNIPMEKNLYPPIGIETETSIEFIEWQNKYYQLLRQELISSTSENNYLNELILSRSPYLLQHANDPINWKPWSEKLLKKADSENKLIFLSIGYSTCHWCHVMQKESFLDESVAKLLNGNYYSIKVDREELPHIDGYFMRALKQLQDNAGWPITVIINGDGLPVFIDSYMTKAKLLKLLPRVNQIWAEKPNLLLNTAKNIDLLVSRDAASLDTTNKEVLDSINLKLLGILDNTFGGFSGKVKFPSEAMILYGLDQLRRSPETELERLLKLQLDNMIHGGLYDHLGGGFYRYTTDQEWKVPHFEKMLYNQAQLIEVYGQAYQYFYDPAYLDVLTISAEFMVNQFYLKNRGFRSAFSADFAGKEGGYYSWSQTELESLDIDKELYETFTIEQSGELGIILAYSKDKDITRKIDKLRHHLLSKRDSRAALYFDNKVLTSWNALAIKSLVTAGTILNNNDYIQLATDLSNRLWDSRFNPKTGALKRTDYSRSKIDSPSERLSYLDDYAYLADAFLSLYDHDGNTIWLNRVAQIKNHVLENFLSSDGSFVNVLAFNDNFSLKIAADSELISPVATLLDVLHKLDKRSAVKKQVNRYSMSINNLIKRVSAEPLDHLYSALVLNNLQNGMTSTIRYFANANGKVIMNCVTGTALGCSELQIQITLKDGWHINSDQPIQDYLVATELEVPKGVKVIYPSSSIVNLGFQKEALSVFEHHILLNVIKSDALQSRIYLSLPLQACNDKMCLLPESMKFVM